MWSGYRPILDALKQFASDTPGKIDHLIQDIEDIKVYMEEVLI